MRRLAATDGGPTRSVDSPSYDVARHTGGWMGGPIDARRAFADMLAATWQSLSDVLSGLDDDEWKTPTDLPGWSVQDTLSHVIGTERLLEGLPAPERLTDDPPPYVRNLVGEFNERHVHARRPRRGAEVLAEWEALRAVRQRTLAAADEEYFAQPMDTPTGPGTMEDFLAVRILDCWVHEQDIRRALDRPGTFDCAASAHTIDRLTHSLPMVVSKRAACPEGAAVAIDLSGPMVRSFVCEVNGGRAAFVDSPSAPVRASIAIDTECYVLLATGRRTPADLADRISAVGDHDLASGVLAGMNVLF